MISYSKAKIFAFDNFKTNIIQRVFIIHKLFNFLYLFRITINPINFCNF